jgi:hypothetical protein
VSNDLPPKNAFIKLTGATKNTPPQADKSREKVFGKTGF